MHRSGLFWKVLLPGLGAIALTTAIVSSDAVAGPMRWLLLLLVVAGAFFHARWIAKRAARDVELLAGAIRQMGQGPNPDDWSDRLPLEASPLVSAIEELQTQVRLRLDELEQGKTDFANTTALLEAVLDTMVEGVVVLDREQRILFANPASRPLLDMQRHEIISRPLWEIARLAPVCSAVETVLNGEGRQQIEYEIPRTTLTIAGTIAALPREPVPGVMLVLHDVTELRRLENIRRDFVSNVSHELKTPLTSIQAYADTLLEEGAGDSEQTLMFLGRIVEQAERLGALIVDIIRLGKVESEPDVFEVQPVRVQPQVQSCLEAHTAIVVAAGISLTADVISTDTMVLADPVEVRTILDNLLDNALRYTPAGGTVSVRVHVGNTGGSLVGIEVADTGIGLAKDQQKRIFERFYRVDRARDRGRGGTGLGLAIVKHLCQIFGGHVDVTSELGVGSRFTVWLPNAGPAGQSSASKANEGGTAPAAEHSRTTDGNRLQPGIGLSLK